MLHIPPLLLKPCLEYSGLNGEKRKLDFVLSMLVGKRIFLSQKVFELNLYIYIACPFKFQFLTVQPTAISGNV